MASTVDWQEGFVDDTVKLTDDRSIHLRASGPSRQSKKDPAVLLLHGLGGSSYEWVATQRAISAHARVYCYDRAGYWPSSPPPKGQRLDLEWIAKDLSLLLDAAAIEPPYVLVGQSYGGYILRQCLLDWPEGWISGVVIVDSAVRLTSSSNVYIKLLGSAKYQDVVGLTANHALTSEEFATVFEVDGKNEAIQELEAKEAITIGAKLHDRVAGRRLLGTKPVSVLYCDTANDFRKIYNYGLQNGHGTDEERGAMATILDGDEKGGIEPFEVVEMRNMKAHLSLSSRSRFVEATGAARTHNVHIVDPNFVAGEVRWVIDESFP